MRQSDGQKSVGQAAMIKSVVLIVLCLQNSVFTLLRRYSLGILQEGYSKVRECVLLHIFFFFCFVEKKKKM